MDNEDSNPDETMQPSGRRELLHHQELDRIGACITRYYDSLNDEEMAEDRAWGEFAESQLPPQ